MPWFVIVDAEGTTLVTSNNAAGENIGFPAAASEIAHFRQMIEQTAQRMTAEQVDALVEQLIIDN